MSFDDFCVLTYEEFESVVSSYTSQRDFFIHDGWERMRQHAAISIQPHVRKRIGARQLLPLPWDKSAPADKKGKDDRKPLSAEESKKRFLQRIGRSG